MRGVSAKELFARSRAVCEQLDVIVTRAPRLAQQRAARRIELRREVVSEKVESGAKGRPPALVPSFGRACVAAAVARPAPESVRATPSRARAVRPLFNLNFKSRPVLRAERAVVRHAKAHALGLGFERVGDAAVAEAEVVAVTLAVGRDVHYLSAGSRGGAHARADERVARREKALEGDCARDLAVVEEDRERTARAVAVGCGDRAAVCTMRCWRRHASAATEASSCSQRRQTCVRGRSTTRAVGGSLTLTDMSMTGSGSWAMSASLARDAGHTGGARDN